MDIGQGLLTVITIVAMIVIFFVSLIPFVPGPAMLWGVSLAYGVLTEFRELTIVSMVIISLLMLATALSDFWTPLLGMKSRGGSCSSVFGTIIGGLLGTFLIPIPLLGTLLGAIGGAMLMEVLRVGDLRTALRAGSFAAESVVIGLVLELVVNVAIIAVFVVSVAF
ncbi:MAG: DUF456 domain-containing protein [Chloroflexota bacterium]|nr:DUF456 domain-containing protein [Chloroflexota bacterium]